MGIFVVTAGICALAVFGATRMRVGTEQIGQFREDAPVRIAFEAVNQKLQGANPFYVVVESDVRDTFKEPENLRLLQELQEWLIAQPEIGGATSLVDYLTLIHRGLVGEDEPASPNPAPW